MFINVVCTQINGPIVLVFPLSIITSVTDQRLLVGHAVVMMFFEEFQCYVYNSNVSPNVFCFHSFRYF